MVLLVKIKETTSYPTFLIISPSVGPKILISNSIKKNFGQQLYNNNKILIHSLTFNDCFSANGSFKALQDWNEMGLPLTVNCWLRIRNAILKANSTLCKNTETTSSESIHEFVAKLKKGSKKIRKIVENT
jgi:hypothetical protein